MTIREHIKINFCLILLALAIFTIGGCGDISEEDLECILETGEVCAKPEPTPTVPMATATPIRTPAKTPSPNPQATPTVSLGGNPVCSGIADSRAHLLWKPVSDTSGNAVTVFDGKYKKEFKSVKAELKSGQFEELFWKPLELWGNPDSIGPRQHWRAKSKCGSFKDKALIIADDGYQACRFVLPGSACKRWE